MNNRKDFEKWYQEHIGDLYTKDLPIGANNTWLAWQEATARQQKIIDDLKQEVAGLKLAIDILKV